MLMAAMSPRQADIQQRLCHPGRSLEHEQVRPGDAILAQIPVAVPAQQLEDVVSVRAGPACTWSAKIVANRCCGSRSCRKSLRIGGE
jgi:hypothetical protein